MWHEPFCQKQENRKEEEKEEKRRKEEEEKTIKEQKKILHRLLVFNRYDVIFDSLTEVIPWLERWLSSKIHMPIS